MKEELNNEACQLREKYQEEVSSLCGLSMLGEEKNLKGFYVVFVF